jgi:5,10-methylene-tetrahydrofolate dehydrogenase/methenyl tetrahydrofolate cyclohydrolase
LFDFLPATAQSVMSLLDFYDYDNVQGKTIAVIGQSNLLGKPLAVHLMNRGATVYTFNEFSNQERMKQLCQQSDYIISST